MKDRPNTYQVQSKMGLVYGCFVSITPQNTLDQLANRYGYSTYQEWADQTGFNPEYKVKEFRIIVD